MERDFEKDLLTSLAGKKKVNMFDFSEHFSNTLDADRHVGLLVQVKAPSEVLSGFLMCEPILVVKTSFIEERFKNLTGLMGDWIESFNTPFVKGKNKFETLMLNQKRNQAISSMALYEINESGHISKHIEEISKMLPVPKEDAGHLLSKMKIELSRAMAMSSRNVSMEVVNDISLVITIEIDIDIFNSVCSLMSLETEGEEKNPKIHYQFVVAGFITEEQESLINTLIKPEALDTDEFYYDEENQCDCPKCKIERQLKELGIDITDSDED